MAELNLDFLIIPTYNKYTLGIADNSTYPDSPPSVISPTLEITVPGGNNPVSIPFTVNDFNVLNSTSLGITEQGREESIPDGIYIIRYTVSPAYEIFIEKSIFRVNKLLESFDEAFMKVDLTGCDNSQKKQEMITLNTIRFFIQGAISAANNCADKHAMVLYKKASSMLNKFINNSKCCGSNFILSYN